MQFSKNKEYAKYQYTSEKKIQKLLDVLKKYDVIAPVNKEQLSTGNTFTNPVIILRKGESLKIVLDARYLNSMIDESKCNWPIEPVEVALTRINGTIFTTADLYSAYNQIPLDEQSMRYSFYDWKRTILFQTAILRNIHWTRSFRIHINTLPLSLNQKRNGNHICRRHLHPNKFLPTNVRNINRIS